MPVVDPVPRPVVLYDGACSFCCRQVARLGRMSGGRLSFRSLPPAAPGDPAPDELRFVDAAGRSYGGAEAIVRALGLRLSWRVLLWPYFLPGLRQLADAAYRRVARRRHH